MPNGAMLPAGTAESRKRAAQWREDIRHAAREAMDERPPFAGPIRLMCEFRLPYPASSIRKYQFGWLPHTKKPDVDKLFRMVADAMTGIVWRDDAQVCFSAINKVYAWDGKTGAIIDVDEIDERSARTFASMAGRIRDRMEMLS